jgi:predicted CXXCH cytochrome family protein
MAPVKPALFALLCTAMLFAAPGPAVAADGCLTCHQSLGDKASGLFAHDVHGESGITCAGCHGGNPATDEMEKGMDPKAGYIGVPKGDQISQMCAGCHADSAKIGKFHASLPTNQFADLKASVHGKLSTTGKEMILQCTRCHGAHGIVRVKSRNSPVNPLNIVATCSACHSNASFMRSYNPTLPVDQLEKYRTSVHGMKNAKGDPLVAECASCHGNHGILSAKDVKSKVYSTNLPHTCAFCHSDPGRMESYPVPTDQFEKYARSVHGKALMEKGDLAAPACNSCHGNHGATPPGVESISKVCGTCHALNADLFSSSPHKQAFDAASLPECETCHGNHEILTPTATLIGTGSDAVCSRCHTDDAGAIAANTMRGLIDSLDALEDSARALVDQAEQRGMEIGEAKYKLRDAHQARLETRTMVHAFDVKRFTETADKGLATAVFVLGEAKAAIDEYYFRRIGLGVATLIITILAVSLYLYIRRLERRQTQAQRS